MLAVPHQMALKKVKADGCTSPDRFGLPGRLRATQLHVTLVTSEKGQILKFVVTL